MAIPGLNELYKEVLLTLENGEPHSNKQLGDTIAKRRNISDEDLAVKMPDGGSTIFRYRIRWAKTHLKNAGLVEYLQRGIAKITDEGKRVLKTNPQVLNREFLHNHHTLLSESGNLEPSETAQEEQTPGERMNADFSEINAVLKSDILEEIMNLSSDFFEQLVAKLLVAMGYGDVFVTPRSGDGGIDGICLEDRLGFSNMYI